MLTRRWTEFAKWVDRYKWGPPPGMTVERIEQAMTALEGEGEP